MASTVGFMFASGDQMQKREALAREFYSVILDPDEEPWFVSDDASLFDIWAGCDEAEVIAPCHEHYGVRLSRKQFRCPFWRLLDYLQEKRISMLAR